MSETAKIKIAPIYLYEQKAPLQNSQGKIIQDGEYFLDTNQNNRIDAGETFRSSTETSALKKAQLLISQNPQKFPYSICGILRIELIKNDYASTLQHPEKTNFIKSLKTDIQRLEGEKTTFLKEHPLPHTRNSLEEAYWNFLNQLESDMLDIQDATSWVSFSYHHSENPISYYDHVRQSGRTDIQAYYNPKENCIHGFKELSPLTMFHEMIHRLIHHEWIPEKNFQLPHQLYCPGENTVRTIGPNFSTLKIPQQNEQELKRGINFDGSKQLTFYYFDYWEKSLQYSENLTISQMAQGVQICHSPQHQQAMTNNEVIAYVAELRYLLFRMGMDFDLFQQIVNSKTLLPNKNEIIGENQQTKWKPPLNSIESRMLTALDRHLIQEEGIPGTFTGESHNYLMLILAYFDRIDISIQELLEHQGRLKNYHLGLDGKLESNSLCKIVGPSYFKRNFFTKE